MKKILYLVFYIVALSSCKTLKTTNKNNTMALTKILKKYNQNNFHQKTIKASLKLEYKGERSIPSLNASLRIEKDKVIWMSLSKFISVAKVKITPNRVQFYNKMNKTYFDGDFSLLSNLLGTEVNFTQIQNIFLGEAIYDINDTDYQITKEENHYIFTPKKNDERFNIFFWLDPNSFKVTQQEIHQSNNARLLSIQCKAYETVEDQLFPKHIHILSKNIKKISTIDINYKSVQFDLPLHFPFEIPQNYKEIQL